MVGDAALLQFRLGGDGEVSNCIVYNSGLYGLYSI